MKLIEQFALILACATTLAAWAVVTGVLVASFYVPEIDGAFKVIDAQIYKAFPALGRAMDETCNTIPENIRRFVC